MAVFLILEEADSEGSFLRKTAVNVDAIARIDSIKPTLCRFLLKNCVSEPVFVSGALDEVILLLLTRQIKLSGD